MTTASLSTIPDTARFLGLSTVELERVIDKGNLAIVPTPGEPLIHEADLEAWLRSSMLGTPVLTSSTTTTGADTMAEPTFITALVPRVRKLIADTGSKLDEATERVMLREVRMQVTQSYRAGKAAAAFLDEIARVTAATRSELDNREVNANLRELVHIRFHDSYVALTEELPIGWQHALREIIYRLSDEAFDEALGMKAVLR